MKPLDTPFLPGRGEPVAGPLARYLPPVAPGMVQGWLEANTAAGEWVLDPFGSSPPLMIEAAQTGRRVVAAVNNPISRFLLEVLAAAPSADDFKAALSELASSRRGEERLEISIRSNYMSECATCGREIEVRAYLWERGAAAPYARIYTCPFCGDQGEHPVSAGDLERLAAYPAGGLHRARALERVAAVGDPTREDVQEALACYLPRPLYTLFTLLNRFEGLPVPASRKALLTALLISACDAATALWQQPPARFRPRQLAPTAHFRENNLWLALEDAITEWTVNTQLVPLCVWPDQPPESGGIAIFQGRNKDLVVSLSDIPVKAIASAIPRPGQAYWTLSALWSGWLWGREAVKPLKSVLSRRRYDWNWHTSALEAALGSLPEHLAPDTPFLGILSELEPGFLAAGLLAAERADFLLEGLAIRHEDGLAQVTWRTVRPGAGRRTEEGKPERVAVQEMLLRRGEPAPFVTAYAAAVAALLEARPAQISSAASAADALNSVQTRLRSLFLDHGFLFRFGGGEHTLESGLWWLVGPTPTDLTLADRIEMEVVRSLQRAATCTLLDVDRAVCTSLPGLLTPSTSMVRAALESYGKEDPPGGRAWVLRPQDQPSVRRSDPKDAAILLSGLGSQLGYQVEGEGPVLWLDERGNAQYVFYLLASAVISRFIYTSPYPADRCLIVLPGSRANLTAYKLRQNPHLQRAVAAGWRFLKFRHLRTLADNPLLDREQWRSQLENDPPEYNASQLSLF